MYCMIICILQAANFLLGIFIIMFPTDVCVVFFLLLLFVAISVVKELVVVVVKILYLMYVSRNVTKLKANSFGYQTNDGGTAGL